MRVAILVLLGAVFVTGAAGNATALPPPAATSVGVSFDKPVLTVVVQDLSVPPSPTPRGWVTSDGVGSTPGIDCGPTCSASFDAGTVVTLWPISFPGSVFEGWTGACSGGDPCVVTMDQARSVTARFDFPNGPTDVKTNFTVSKSGSGDGTVTSNPPGISCGSGCSARYPANVNITLTASPGEGSKLGGWSGACAGAGTSTTCVVAVGPANGVTATFEPKSAGAIAEPPPKGEDPPNPPKGEDPPKPTPLAELGTTTTEQKQTIAGGPFGLHISRARALRVIELGLTLRADAKCRVRLLRRGSVIVVRRLEKRAGARLVSLVVPRRVGAGRYRVELVLTDSAARHQRLTWPVRL